MSSYVKFRRTPILKSSEEEKLKKQLTKIWYEKLPNGDWAYKGAKKIVSHIDIGENTWKLRLKPEYIYFYRKKFGLKKRRKGAIKEGETRYKSGPLRETDIMELSEFAEYLNKIKPLTFHSRRKRAFLTLVFYTGLRQGEIRMLIRNDFEITKNALIINAFREKKGLESYVDLKKAQEATYSIYLDRKWPFVNELISWISRFSENEKVFNFSHTTAWNITKSVFKNKYPHYFRMNRIAHLCNMTELSLAEIQRVTGLHIATIQKYMSKAERFTIQAMLKQKFPQVNRAKKIKHERTFITKEKKRKSTKRRSIKTLKTIKKKPLIRQKQKRRTIDIFALLTKKEQSKKIRA